MFAAVDAYDRHIGRYGRALGRQLIAAADLHQGDRALDVGCGTGMLTGELVSLLGVDHVAAVEPSPAFFAAVRERFPTLDVHQTGGESLPFSNASFDASLAQLVVNFMSDAHAGVFEMKRVTRLGGAVVAAVWDYSGGMTLLRRFWDAAAATTGGSNPQDELNMRYGTPQSLEGLWAEVGLSNVSAGPVDVTASYESFEDLWYGFEQGVGPAGAYAVSLPAEQRVRLKDELRRILGAGDTPFELTARAWMVVGQVG
jgi:SAM-dependent methyltransferase